MLIYGHRGNGATNQGQWRDTWQDYVTQKNRDNNSGSNGRVPRQPDRIVNYHENSLPAFNHALENGADGIELDVYITKDGVPIVTHDDEISKNVFYAMVKKIDHGRISEKTVSEIQQIDMGFGEKFPTLDQVLDLVAAHNPAYKARTGRDLSVIIELKGRDAEKPVHDVIMKRVDNGWKEDQFLCCSFTYDHLRKMRALDKDIKLGPGIKSRLLFGDDGVDANYKVLKREYQPDAISALQRLHDEIGFSSLFPVNTDVKPELLKLAQKNGMNVICWTWNEKHPMDNHSQLKTLLQLDSKFPGVVHLMTDFPGAVGKQIERIEAKRPLKGGLSSRNTPTADSFPKGY